MGYCVLARFWAENAAGFFSGVVLGFRCFFALALPPSLSPPPPPPPPTLLGAGPGALSFLLFVCRQDSGLPVPGQAGASYTCSLSFLSPLSARVGRPPPPPSLPPSFCPCSLSLSLLSLSLFASMHSEVSVNLVDPASSHTLVSKTKPGMSQRKRFTARLRMAHYYSNDFCRASPHMDNCEESRAHTGDVPEFWGMFVIVRHRIGAGSALLLG